MSRLKLAVISTHPIQYHAPLFEALAESRTVHPRVFFTWSQTADAGVVDPGFGRTIAWDIPLLEGYEHEFVPNIARSPGNGRFWGLRNPDLTRVIAKWRAEAVLVFGWNSASHLGAMRHFKGRIPVLFRGDSTLLDRSTPWRSVARRAALWWVYRHIDAAIAVGSNNRDYFRWCGVADERIAFAPHAIDTKRFHDRDGTHERRAAEWRQGLGIPAGVRTVLFAGKLQPKKEPLLLLETFLESGAPGHLIFVGSGVLERELRARAEGQARVHFIPFQNQQAMPTVYRLGDVFVLPSRGPGETWGLALNEAMASRRAVISSSKVGGARDLVQQGVNGWVFEAGSREQLTTVVRRALECDSETLRAMGEAARCTSAEWSIAAAAEGIERTVVGFCSRAPLARQAAIR